jgi:hypothetical protein
MLLLIYRESFEEVLSIAGVHTSCPPLLPIMESKTKKEDSPQELHCKDDGEGMTQWESIVIKKINTQNL